MAEVPKRLAPQKDTVFQLGAKSGNECAYPGCPARMFNELGVMIGQICHIEAAEVGGPRFNPAMTNEQRRHISNLMLMCYPHHKTTDDEIEYPTPKMQQMKGAHEARFTTAPQDLLLMLQDWTLRSEPTPAVNLRRLERVLGWGITDDQLEECVDELAAYTQRYARVPQQAREFLMSVVERMAQLEGSAAVTEGGWGTTALLAKDFEAAFRVSDRAVSEYAKLLDAHRIGGVDLYTLNRPGFRRHH